MCGEAVALRVLISGRVKFPMEPLSGQCGCLKTYWAPRWISSDKVVTMPAAWPNVDKFLNVANLIDVTQFNATSKEHRDTFGEIIRVADIAENNDGVRGAAAVEVLKDLKDSLLAKFEDIVIENHHAILPEEYFVALNPRFLNPPKGSKFSMLRIKLGNTKKLPYSCLELRSKEGTYLPWMTVDAKESGYLKCDSHFKDYPGLVRHLATRHYVLWLSFLCPWCESVGFEKAKITRHVANCASMPKVVVDMVESIERSDNADVISAHVDAAREVLEKVVENDARHGFERRITLTMSREESIFRAFAEKSDKPNKKERWGKSWKPDEERCSQYEGTLDVWCAQSRKFPYFAICPGACKRTYMDTEMASVDHLSSCDVLGFANFHSQRALDEGVVDDVDRLMFTKWKDDAEKAVKNFIPEVAITVDGMGGRSFRKNKGDNTSEALIDIVKKEAVPLKKNPSIRAQRFVKKNEHKGVAGGMRVIYQSGQEEVKEKLTAMVVNMSSFKKMAEKRKVNMEDLNEKNLKRKCSRKTTQKELFDDRWKEHFDQLYGYGQVEHLDQFEWSEVDA